MKEFCNPTLEFIWFRNDDLICGSGDFVKSPYETDPDELNPTSQDQ